MRIFLLLLLTATQFSFAQARKTIAPPALKKGDTIAIIATARKVEAASLQPAVELFKSWGLNVIMGKSIGKSDNQLAGPDWQRATDLQEMLDNPSVKAIVGAKGGYGTVRIIDRVTFEKFKIKPKWIVGFSDMTVLHSHMNTLGYQTIHGLVGVSAKNATQDAKESLKKALFGQKPQYDLPAHAFNRKGKAKAELVGGNLSVLYSVLGSKSEADVKGKILFIEDLDEYLYHIDRMLFNLKRNNYFDHVKGVIIGGMTEMNDNDIPWGKNAQEIVRELFKEYDFPVIYNFPAGHIRDNRALILGASITMEVNDSGSTVRFE
ncbi:S66 peptidase family protein [Flavobacterium selenitireducens]|uniref:S66 peptidase family protein n=1 Tax=Flavobacterium selenitireducens TaxID=2722704 RepID=UPI00168AD60D|nr:LD-carboxypeptidase [Flavobacterium selenitireducens]MBD3581700.1 LD-carboxypeptidase [Flavobacterium selenitireducens]